MKKIINKNWTTAIILNNFYFFKNNKKFLICLYKNFFFGNKINNINNNIHINLESSTILKKNKFSSLKENKINFLNNNIFFSNFFFFFKKFKFKGKGFKIRKMKTKKIKFFFGHSHFLYFFNFSIILNKLNKSKHLFISPNNKKLKKNINFWLRVKPLSWYTKRGLRLSKQVTQIRTGKKGY